jgi:mannose-6-phosphate isomerase-like protein (cupin superfamily)
VKIRLRERATFQADRMAKIALAATPRVLLDLYALEPGQGQKVHSHDDQDKIYVVLEGRGRITVGAQEETVEAGEAVVAPAGTAHGVTNDSGVRLLILVLVSPPPPHA